MGTDISYPIIFGPHIPYPRFFTPQYPISHSESQILQVARFFDTMKRSLNGLGKRFFRKESTYFGVCSLCNELGSVSGANITQQ